MLTRKQFYPRLQLFRTFSAMLALSIVFLLCGFLAFLPQTISIAHADETAPDLPSWAIGPFTRSFSNPLLTPEGTGFESKNVYNL